MTNMMRVWLLLWVISDMMIFQMNAVPNDEKVSNNHNRTIADETATTTTASVNNKDNSDIGPKGFILKLHNPNDTDNVSSTDVKKNKSEDHQEPIIHVILKNREKDEKDQQHSLSTTTPTTMAPSNSTEKPMEIKNISLTQSNKTAAASLIPPASVNSSIEQKAESQQKIIISSVPDCPPLQGADKMTQTELIRRLVHVCRYDRLERPVSYDSKKNRQPVDVYTRAYVYFMQNLDVHDLKYNIHLLFQLRYVDPRLVFRDISNRKLPIVGRDQLSESLWSPHIFMANARASNILGTAERDVLTSVSADGTVIISTRIQATLNCWMNLHMYPFDRQKCETVFESWMYNSSELELHWEEPSPIAIAPEFRLTEYALMDSWTNKTVVRADLNNLRHGSFTGNYSSISFTLHLSREMGCFLMDYFLPSIMIVSLSWVSFWLRADAPPRIVLGTSSLLTFITLASTQGRALPKVSYIKMSEVWFVGCCLFIFASLIEYAFVNSIYRREKNVELKKLNSKYILKSSLTPQPKRKNVNKASLSPNPSSSPACINRKNKKPTINHPTGNHLSIQNSNHESIPQITTGPYINDSVQNSYIDMEASSSSDNINDTIDPKQGWTTMTPQEIALWIDRRARIMFPCAFIMFNIVYWTVAYYS